MESNQDYDTLLRSIFESCDTTGSGLISTNEFEDLCNQLSLESEYALLYEYLFQTDTLLSYDRFREGLLQLLAGTLLPGSENEDGVDRKSLDLRGDLNGNDVTSGGDASDREITCEGYKASKADKGDKSCYGANVEDPDWLVIDFRQQSKQQQQQQQQQEQRRLSSPGKGDRLSNPVATFDQQQKQHRNSLNANSPTPSPRNQSSPSRKSRKYGRRTLPDTELLGRKSASRYDMTSAARDQQNRLGQQCDDVSAQLRQQQHSHVTQHSRLSVEEFVGEGDGGDWTNPDSEFAQMDETSSTEQHQQHRHQSDDAEAEQSSTAADAQEALGAIWQQIIGDLNDNIDIRQLQELYQALSLTSSGGDVQQLFDVLDSDGDGLISFHDFARQMSLFLSVDSACDVTQDDAANLNDYRRSSAPALHTTPFASKNRNSAVSTPSIGDFSAHPSVHSTPNLSPARRPFHSTCQTTPSPSNKRHTQQESTSDFVSTPPSDACYFTSSPSKSDYSSSLSSTGGRTSLDRDEAEDCDMKSYEGVPAYRRRRRTNHNATRNRRRSSRATALPHYHPISRRRLEESPLYFLTGDSGRYVDVESLQAIWKEDGIEDPDQVLKDLGVNLDDSFSVEVLSEAMESELKDTLVHQAVCSIYKSGIKYYRSQKEHESSERTKLESKAEYLNVQLQDQEDRIEKMECDFQGRLDDVESDYKDQIMRLNLDLNSFQGNLDKHKDEEITRLHSQVEHLKEIEEQLRSDIDIRISDYRRLEEEHHTTLQQLNVADVSMNQMRADFEAAFHRMAVASKSQLEQNQLLESMMTEYRKSASRLRDENDELFNDLDQMKLRWNSHDKVNLAYMGRSGKSPTHRTANRGDPRSPFSQAPPPTLASAPVTGASGDGKWHPSTDPDASMSEMSLASDAVATSKGLSGQSLFAELEATNSPRIS